MICILRDFNVLLTRNYTQSKIGNLYKNKTMKKRLLQLSALAIIFLFSMGTAFAQSGSWNYVVTGGPSSPVNMTGADTVGAGGDDVVYSFKWPFAGIIYDNLYTVTNDIYINSNGIIRFDAALYVGAGAGSIPTFPTNNSQFKQCISYGGDSDGHIPGQIVKKVTGASGSRVLTLAFTYYTNYTGTTSYHADIQVSYYESSHNLKIDYSNVGGSNTASNSLGINAGDGVWGANFLSSFPTQDTSFTLAPGATFDPPATFTATAVSSNEIDLSWTKNSSGSDVLLVYNTTNNFGNPVLGTAYSAGATLSGGGTVLYVGGNTSLIIDTIPPSQTRYYKIWSKLSGYNYYSQTALSANATTFPLPPPTSFTATSSGSNQIDLSWVLNTYGDSVIITYNTTNTFANPVDGNSYIVGNQIAPGQGTVIYKGTGTTKTHTGLSINTQYFYKIWSFNDGYYYSVDASANATTQPPADPQSFTATASGMSIINLAWTLNASGNNVIVAYNTTGSFGTPQTGTNYPIGNTIGGAGTGTVIVNGNSTSYSHTGLNTNTVYYYKIWSYDATYNYSPGLTANDTTGGIVDPSNFSATTVSSSAIDLAWSGVTPGDSVMIVFSTSLPFATPSNGYTYWVGGGLAPNQTVIYYGNASGSPFHHTGLTASTKYYYKIWAYDNTTHNYSSPGKLDSATTMSPGIAVYPYIEDFETQTSNQGNVSGCQTYFPLSTGWQNAQTGDNIDWIARKGPTPTGNWGTGPAVDHTLGTSSGTYLYTESTNCYNKEAWLVSPLFNFTNLTNPQLKFYYHMYGSTMGTLSVQVSTDGGTTWSTNLFYKSGQQQTSQTAPYGMALVNLSSFAGNSSVTIRINGKTGSSWRSDMAIDDIKVFQPTPMTISSVTTEQDSLPVVLASTNQQVIRVKITTSGDYNFLTLNSLIFNTTGTPNLSDISNAKVFYTGNNPDFSATSQFGSVVASPNGNFIVTGSQTLAEGINYFWLTYDIPASATIGHVVDAQCTQATISSTTYTPTVTSPPGNKTIVGRIIVGTGTASEWQGPVYPAYYHSAHEAIYTSSELGSGSKEIKKLAWHKASGANVTDHIDLIKVYMKNSPVSTLSSGNYSLAGYTLVYQGIMPNNKLNGWMEIPLSSPFLYNGTGNIHVLVVQTKPSSTWSGYPYYNYSTTSVNRVRRKYNFSSPPTNLTATTHRPNIRFEYVLPAPMVYSSSTVIQPNIKNVGTGDVNQEIIGIKVTTQHTGNPLSVTSLDLNTLGSTNAGVDIANAKVYYTGSNPSFATTSQFGSTKSNPNGSYTVTGSQVLDPGDNYFWVAYDIKSTATVNHVVDARCTSITVGGTAKTPTITNPTGNRKIKKYITIGNIGLTTKDLNQPLHTYQYHGWEAIYTSAEMGAAKDLTGLAFYKKSGTNTTNDILNVTIYVKHTSDSTLATGNYSTAGYTQVFSGNFPNDATSGWMQVNFAQPFAYNGTSNIEVLIEQSYGQWFTGGPQWSYNTKTPNRARFASSWSSQPTSLTASNRLASIRFEYEPPQPMTYVSSTVTQSNITNIVRGLPSQEVIGIEVVTQNSANPLTVTSFTLNTNGSSNASADISNARIYYTGTSPTFVATAQMGVKANPNGSFTITGSQPLTYGVNHFWLAYDIAATATLGNHVDAECTSITVSSQTKTPTVTAPAGNRTIVGALSGYYTIGTGGDYASFTAAVSDLNTYGVSGWVTFRVLNGTYNEQITLGAVANASASRPITFESYSGDSSLAVLSYSPSSSSNSATLTIDGTSYYRIKNLTIKSGGNYGRVIELKNGAYGNLIRNCRLISTSTSTYYSTGVYVYANNANNNQIIQNYIQSTGYGLYLRGASSTSLVSGLVVDSNTISTGRYGVYGVYMSGFKFRKNTISLSGQSTAYGLYLFYSDNAMDVSANKFAVTATNTAYGIYSRSSDASSSVPNRFFNNFIAVTGNPSNTAIGIQAYLDTYLDIDFNNINITSTSSGTRAAIYAYSGNNIKVRNNNAAAPGGGYSLYYYNSSQVSESDYNNLYSTGSVGYFNGTTATTLSSWKTASGKDAHSVAMNPQYVSTTDLHIGNFAMDNLGYPVSGITVDIDDSLRNLTTPDIGADEFSVDYDAELTAVTAPTSPICGGNQNVSVTLKNNGLITITSATINWSVGGTAQTAYSWTGSLATGATQNVTLGSYNFATIGNISITAQVTNPNGQTDQVPLNDTTSATIVVNGAATANAGPDDTLCGSGAYTLSNATATSYSAVLWTTSGSGTFTNGNTVNASYTPSAADLSSGLVTLKISVTGLGSCGNAEDSMNLTLGNLPSVSFTGLASDYCDNAVAASLTGTPANGTFSGPGITGSQFDPATAGAGNHTIIYSVSSNGCTGADTQYVDVHETPIANAGSDKTINPPTTTTATLNGSYSGGSNVGYFWTPANLLNNPNIASPTTTAITSSTTYTLETKDTINQCSSTDQVLVTVFTGGPLTVTATASPTAICAGDSTLLTALANGGSGNYTYSWTSSPVGFTSNASQVYVKPNVATTYTVVVNDGSTNANSSVSVTVNPLPTVSFTGLNPTACNNGSAMTLNGTPSGGTFSSNGSGLSGSTYDPAIAGPGNFEVYYNYTDANGCSNVDTQSVVISDAPIANAGSDVTIAQGHDTIVYGSATGGGNYTYNWAPTSMLANPNIHTPNELTVVLNATQVYTLTVIDTVTTCQSSDDVTVTVSGGALSVNVTADKTTICDGDTVQLNAVVSGGTGNYTYTWSSTPLGFSSTIANPQVTPSVTTVYSVVVNDGNNSVNSSVTITVNTTPLVSFSGLQSKYCANAIPDTLLGIPNGGLFSGPGIAANIFDPKVAGIGTHTISYAYTASNGCSATATQTTSVYGVPVANAGADQIINVNTSTTLNGSATGGNGTYSYDWTPASLLTNANIQNPTTVPMTVTTLFTLAVSDTNNCMSTDDVTIQVKGGTLSVNPIATPDTICAGDQIQLNALASGGSGNYIYAWVSNPSGFIDLTANPTANPTVTTTYIINVFDGTNTVSDSVTVVVGAIPTVSISTSQTNYCENGVVDTLVGLPAGGTFFGTGMINNQFDPQMAGIGTHQISYKYTSSFGCSNADTVDLTVVAAPLADAGSDIVVPCGSTGGIIGSPAVNGLVYSWNPAAGLQDPNASTTNANPSMSTLYTVTVLDTITTCSNTDDVQVDVTGGPSAIVSNDTIICAGDSVTISASGGTSYQWSNGLTTQSFTVSPKQTTVYTVVVSDTSACTATDSVTVTVNHPQVFLGPDITVVDTSSVILDAGYGYVDYQWSTGDLTQSIIVEPYINAQLGINTYSVLVTDVYGCQAGDTINIEYVLSIGDISKDVSFGIYPNPTKGKFNLVIEGTIDQKFSLDIMNLQGRIVKHQEIYVNQAIYNQQIDISTFAKGVYLVRLMNEGLIITRKLIVQ